MLAGANKIRLGDLLVANAEINEQQLNEALVEQKISGAKLGDTLVQKGFIAEERLLRFLAEQLDVPFVDLRDFRVNEDLVALLPETYARRYRSIVLAEEGDSLQVGMADPIDIFAYDEVARQLGRQINLAVVRESDLMSVLDVAYRRTDEIENIASELHGELSIDEFRLDAYQNDDEDTPVARLLQSILEDAVQVRASDIHIEPDGTVLRLRMRVDGVLQEQILPEVRIASALVSRLKLMAGLDISEKRLPQDGRFEHKLKNTNIDVRLSTLPTTHGESVVMRLVDRSDGVADLSQVGLDEVLLKRFRNVIRRPNGLVLVTGPTGSGKTTTLYGALRELNSLEKKIITVEDPVEVALERVNQVQINSKIGLDFAKVLRSTLRQDPDILLLGEIRDAETAEIALRAAMTGHLVLSTLHTNDAVSSAMRLIDIGVPGYMVASSVRAIVAQRLIRKVCVDCKTAYELTGQIKEWLVGVDPNLVNQTYMHGTGCNKCNQTGYRGRIGVFEMLEMQTVLADALRRGDTEAFSNAALEQDGYLPLVQRALQAAEAGETSLAEVMNLWGQEDEGMAELLEESPPELLAEHLARQEREVGLDDSLRH